MRLRHVYTKMTLTMEQRERRPGHGGGRPRISEAIEDRCVELYLEGEMTCGEIAKALGISSASVFRIINRRTEES